MSYKLIKWSGSGKPTSDDLEMMFTRRNLEYYIFTNSAGYHYEMHSHDYNKFLVISKGKMKWIIEDKEETLTPGDAVVVHKDTPHEVHIIEDSECWEGHF